MHFSLTKFHYSVFLLLIALTSCQEDITYDFPEYQPKIVVYSMFRTGEKPLVYISESKAVFNYADTLSNLVPNATVIFMKNTSSKRDTMYFTQSGYSSTRYLSPGIEYTIEAHYKGMTAIGKATIPDIPVISGITFHADTVPPDNTHIINSTVSFNVSLKDIWGEKNFYRLKSVKTNWSHGTSNNNTSSEYIGTFFSDGGNDGGILSETYVSETHEFLTSPWDSVVYFFTVESVTEDAKNFITSASVQSASNSDPLSEPSPIKGNILGGLGVVGGISESQTFRVKVK